MVKHQTGKHLGQISMKLSVELWQKLRLRAVQDDITETQIVVTLVEECLAKKTIKKRAAD